MGLDRKDRVLESVRELFKETKMYEDVSSENMIGFLEYTENNQSWFEGEHYGGGGDVVNPDELVKAMNDSHVEWPAWNIEITYNLLPWKNATYDASTEYRHEGSDFEADSDQDLVEFMREYDTAGGVGEQFKKKGEMSITGTVTEKELIEELE